jgi:hypothetical protein
VLRLRQLQERLQVLRLRQLQERLQVQLQERRLR